MSRENEIRQIAEFSDMQLNITNFSCIREANISVAPVTLIIGPQGSGKSVTTKLVYFFTDIISSFVSFAERDLTVEEYKKWLSKEFCIWFPPGAWGRERFNISYGAGPFEIRVLRRKTGGKLSDEVSVTFSDWFMNSYSRCLDLFRKDRNRIEETGTSSVSRIDEDLQSVWRVRNVIENRISKDLGSEYVSQQTFIPAGRAYFTSIGRLVAGMEQGGVLDPVTLRFAKLFANLRDRNSSRFLRRKVMDSEYLTRRKVFMEQLFGGEIKFEQDNEFVEAADGRKIPFRSLSSGQQELMPMWSLIDYFSELDARRATATGVTARRFLEYVFIEEPEAHLFPSAQSLLMEFLIGSVASDRKARSLIITTHSPYIMSKINVFLKAGQLSRRKKRNNDLNKIVPRECWLYPGQIQALSIFEGSVKSILDDDGFVDSAYLDEVSEQISREYSELLDLESEMNQL